MKGEIKMINGRNRIKAFLLDEINRKAGSGEIEGEMRSWSDAKQLKCLPCGETRQIYKYTVAPEREDIVGAKIANANWGCLVELTFVGKNKVQDIEIISDIFADQIEL